MKPRNKKPEADELPIGKNQLTWEDIKFMEVVADAAEKCDFTELAAFLQFKTMEALDEQK